MPPLSTSSAPHSLFEHVKSDFMKLGLLVVTRPHEMTLILINSNETSVAASVHGEIVTFMSSRSRFGLLRTCETIHVPCGVSSLIKA